MWQQLQALQSTAQQCALYIMYKRWQTLMQAFKWTQVKKEDQNFLQRSWKENGRIKVGRLQAFKSNFHQYLQSWQSQEHCCASLFTFCTHKTDDVIQYSISNFYSAGIIGRAKFKCTSSQKVQHWTHVQRKAMFVIKKSGSQLTMEDTSGQKGVFRHCRKQVRDLEQQIHRGSLFQEMEHRCWKL